MKDRKQEEVAMQCFRLLDDEEFFRGVEPQRS